MCNQEFPDLQLISDDYQAQGFVILGLNTGGQGGGETEETVRAFIEQTGCTFTFAWDLMGETMQQFAFPQAISPFPRQALIGKDRTVEYVNAEYDNTALRSAIEAALAK